MIQCAHRVATRGRFRLFRIFDSVDCFIWLLCGVAFKYLYSRPVRGNKYSRTEELYQCEDCAACPHKEKCCKCEGNRIVRLNEELTEFHKEVLGNLNSVHGALLRMNRSIQAEGAFGAIKWNKAYQRIRRRGLKRRPPKILCKS